MDTRRNSIVEWTQSNHDTTWKPMRLVNVHQDTKLDRLQSDGTPMGLAAERQDTNGIGRRVTGYPLESSGWVAEQQPRMPDDSGKSLSGGRDSITWSWQQLAVDIKPTLEMPPNASYYSSAHSTFRPNGQQWSLNYADDSRASGVLGSDDITVAGITVKDQIFGVASVNTGSTGATSVDGIMGLGLESNSIMGNAGTPVINMLLQSQIDEAIVSVWLNKASNQDTSLSDGGEFIFGGVDPSLYTGSITFVPVTSSKDWQVTVDRIFIGRKELSVSSSASSAIIDTGSSYILFPDYLAVAFHRAIPNSQYDTKLGWLIPCAFANSRSVWDLVFMIGGQKFSVPISDIVILRSEYNGYCLSAVDSWQELPGHGGQSGILLGDLFIKNQYVVFDYTKKQVGFAKKVETAPGGIGLNAKGAAGAGLKKLIGASRASALLLAMATIGLVSVF
ncbi:hypothetical protein BGZ72_004450 [Mortierella alpina]|nr:hypothetical protein BGZ72_004450 [Mortierella alpina]